MRMGVGTTPVSQGGLSPGALIDATILMESIC